MATKDDIARIATVIDAAYAPWRAALPDLPDVSAGLLDEVQAGRLHVFDTDDGIAGVVNFSMQNGACHIMNIAVDPGQGGKGLGQQLMAHAETLARRAGCRVMQLATHAKMTRNVAFYQRLGWHVVEQTDRKVVMQRDLGPE